MVVPLLSLRGYGARALPALRSANYGPSLPLCPLSRSGENGQKVAADDVKKSQNLSDLADLQLNALGRPTHLVRLRAVLRRRSARLCRETPLQAGSARAHFLVPFLSPCTAHTTVRCSSPGRPLTRPPLLF